MTKNKYKQSTRPLESFDSRMHKLLIATAMKSDAGETRVEFSDPKVAFRFRMDIAKLNKELKRAAHLDKQIRSRLAGLKIASEANAVIIKHYDADYMSTLDDVLLDLDTTSVPEPDIDALLNLSPEENPDD